MISINTNLSSIITQNALRNSTLKLNTAVERLTTGYKINCAKDNAANYSISTNMSSKISSYQVAEDNCTMGLDLISAANDSLDLVSNNLARLRALAEQAVNGTYGKQSIKAMNAEAAAIINEIYRAKNNVELNGQKVFGTSAIDENIYGASGLEVNEQGFLQEINVRDTGSMKKLASVDENQTLAVGTYSISSAEELAKLARMQNAGKVAAGSEFVLGADIDLSEYSSGNGWTPIGEWDHRFSGTFDGNGYKISNLYIDAPLGYRGLFGCIQNATIKNIGINSGEIRCANINSGGLIGAAWNSTIRNCYTTIDLNNVGVLDANGWLGVDGGLIGRVMTSTNIDYCYTTGDIKSNGHQVGGLVGSFTEGTITNCFATGNIIAKDSAGGLIGLVTNGTITNCFATGNVRGNNTVGGFIGSNEANITNCHSSGNVFSQGNSNSQKVGGFTGTSNKNIVKNCYSTGNVYSDGSFVGGFVGVTQTTSNTTITNCIASGNVEAKGLRVGGFIGQTEATLTTVENCSARGNVKGSSYVGGFVGNTYNKIEIRDCYATGDIANSGSYSGGLCGSISNSSIIENSYSTGNVNGNGYSGGLVGMTSSSQITNCYTTSNVNGTGSYIGGLAGYSSSTLTDCYVLGKSENVKGAIAGYANGTITNCRYDSLYNDTALKGGGSATLTDCEVYEGSEPFKYNDALITMQVGINGNSNSRINVDLGFDLGNLKDISAIGLQNIRCLNIIDDAIKLVSSKQTILGSSQNRLESALNEISTHYENLSSSRSTLRDADIAKVSSEYIKHQILQQASATLLATANQTPALALQLL